MSLRDELARLPVAGKLLASASLARNQAIRAQETLFEALNLPTAATTSRLEARLRAAFDRIGRLENEVDDLRSEVSRARSRTTSGG